MLYKAKDRVFLRLTTKLHHVVLFMLQERVETGYLCFCWIFRTLLGGKELEFTKRLPLKTLVFCTMVIVSLFLLVGCDSDEVKSAKGSLNAEIERIEGQITDLQTEIEAAELLIQTDEIPLDDTVIPTLESTISEAKTVEFIAPKTPSELEEINAEIEGLKAIDYEASIQALKDSEQAVTDSIEQMKLVTNPSEAFVIERLQGVDGVGDISAVTEDNDPNGMLNKAGGYTATVYFTSPLVNQGTVIGNTVIEKGTSGGGAIEVFANVDDAKKRNDYLGAFDGSFLSNGSHSVFGTVVVRTSDNLTASKQKQLEAAIVEALTRLS